MVLFVQVTNGRPVDRGIAQPHQSAACSCRHLATVDNNWPHRPFVTSPFSTMVLFVQVTNGRPVDKSWCAAGAGVYWIDRCVCAPLGVRL